MCTRIIVNKYLMQNIVVVVVVVASHIQRIVLATEETTVTLLPVGNPFKYHVVALYL